MNLSPSWIKVLNKAGFEAVHWSNIGPPSAEDKTLMAWAIDHERIVFTHDLDFSALLAASQAQGPSVFQVRSQNIMPQHLGKIVVSALRQFEETLKQGALVTVDEKRSRVRILPLEIE